MSTLNYIKHQDINFTKWDQTVLKSKFPTVFAQSYYLNATSPNWDALVMNDYESIFPLTWRRKYGVLYLAQPFFTSQLGLFGIVDDEREKVFNDYIVKQYKFIEIELNNSNNLSSEFIKDKNTYLIDYSKTYSFNQNTKRNCEKARSLGLKVETVSDQQLEAISKQILNPFLLKELKLPEQEVNRFETLLGNCITSGNIKTFKTINETGDIKAIGHFVFNNKYVVFLKVTNTDKEENSGSMHLLITHAIQFFSNQCNFFDFGGGSLNQGLAGFYKGLGGEKLEYKVLKVNNLPKLIKLFKK
jgi:hypothetical protein